MVSGPRHTRRSPTRDPQAESRGGLALWLSQNPALRIAAQPTTLNLSLAALGSTLSAASIARNQNLCLPPVEVLDPSSAKVTLTTTTATWRKKRPQPEEGQVGLSFGYLTLDDRVAADGTKELVELDLFEVTLTPTPANADTRVLETKSLGDVRVRRFEC